MLSVVELMSRLISDLESFVDVADRLLGMPVAWMELVKSPDLDAEEVLGNTATFRDLEDMMKKKLEREEEILIVKTNIMAQRGTASGTRVTFPDVFSGSRVDFTSSGVFSGLLLKGPILAGLYKRNMEAMGDNDSLETHLIFLDIKDTISEMVLHLDTLTGAVSQEDSVCAFLNQVTHTTELWQLEGKDGSSCQHKVEQDELLCNCSTSRTTGINMFGGFSKTLQTTTTTTTTTSTTNTTTTSSTNSAETTTASQDSTSPSGSQPTEGSSTSQPPTTTDTPCMIASPMPVTLPLSVALLLLAQVALVVVAVIHYLRNRVLPKFLNIIFLAIILQVFVTNWIYLGIVYQRDAERSSCDFPTLSTTVQDHKGVYTILGPMAAFLWQSSLLSIFAFLLVTFLDLRSWQGSQSLTSLCTLASLVLLVPIVLTVVSCVASEYGADTYLPVLIPQQWSVPFPEPHPPHVCQDAAAAAARL